jgi:hypothetical protein
VSGAERPKGDSPESTTRTTPSLAVALRVPSGSEGTRGSLGESTRFTSGDTASASLPTVAGEEPTAHQATAAICTAAGCGKSDWRSQVENGAVTGDAARSSRTHAQTVRIIDRGG